MNSGSDSLVSILMTCYNREKYISAAIESTLASTYTNFELIIIDDSSTDGTVKIAKEYVAKDERVKVYVNDKNMGDYPNRNKAAGFAKGKYIKYVDSDDYIYPNGLEIMVRSMEQFPEAGFGLCSSYPDADKPFPFICSPMEAYKYNFLGPGLFQVGPLSAIFVRGVFETAGGFSEERMVSDTDMWHRMALEYPVVLMQEGLVWRRTHKEQELSDKKYFLVKGEKIKWKYFNNAHGFFTNDEKRKVKKSRLRRYALFAFGSLRHFRIKEAIDYLSMYGHILKN